MELILRLLFWLLLPVVVVAATPLEHARRAQALLGPETWSRVLRIENTAGGGAYPATVFALVFESGGILWFYTDTDGTQSLSLHREQLEEEKAELGPLLRAIEPGFAGWRVVGDAAEAEAVAATGELPNGCFVESLAALRRQVRRGEPVERARLLSLYIDTPLGRRGHTVLTYETRRGLFLVDPGRTSTPQAMPTAWADNAPALAEFLWPGVHVARARWVPTTLPVPPLFMAGLAGRGESGADAPRVMR